MLLEHIFQIHHTSKAATHGIVHELIFWGGRKKGAKQLSWKVTFEKEKKKKTKHNPNAHPPPPPKKTLTNSKTQQKPNPSQIPKTGKRHIQIQFW